MSSSSVALMKIMTKTKAGTLNKRRVMRGRRGVGSNRGFVPMRSSETQTDDLDLTDFRTVEIRAAEIMNYDRVSRNLLKLIFEKGEDGNDVVKQYSYIHKSVVSGKKLAREK